MTAAVRPVGVAATILAASRERDGTRVLVQMPLAAADGG